MAEIQGDQEPVEPAPGAEAAAPGARPGADRPRQEDDGAYIVKVRDATSSPESTAGRARRRDRCRRERSIPPCRSRPPRHRCDRRTCPPVFLRAAPPVPSGFAWPRVAPPEIPKSRRREWTRTSSLGSSCGRPKLPPPAAGCPEPFAATGFPQRAASATKPRGGAVRRQDVADAVAVAGGGGGAGGPGGPGGRREPARRARRPGVSGRTGRAAWSGVAGGRRTRRPGPRAGRRPGVSAGIASGGGPHRAREVPERAPARAKPAQLPHLSPLPPGT